MKTVVVRLKRGCDLLKSIKQICEENNIEAGIVLSSVGCVTQAKIRCAGGERIDSFSEKMEIISLNGTVSKNRVHLHISLSKEDLSLVGGHLVEGCIINTTSEIAILVLDGEKFEKEFDETTGYNELKITKIQD